MIIFDFLLLIGVSVLLGVKSLYLASVTLIIGLLIGFQSQRVLYLLGKRNRDVSVGRKVKAIILSVLLGACFYPFIEGEVSTPAFDHDFTPNSVLPIVIVIGLFSAATMAALAVEKRKR